MTRILPKVAPGDEVAPVQSPRMLVRVVSRCGDVVAERMSNREARQRYARALHPANECKPWSVTLEPIGPEPMAIPEKPFRCGRCNRRFADEAKLTKHAQRCRYRYFCKACGRGFVHRSQAGQHNCTVDRTAPRQSTVCPNCGKDCRRPCSLRSHLTRCGAT